ncbi:hypothetical protein CGC43_07055 [Francisella opportunistica]|uniref:Transposase IS66 C-terminal domain-containing protein n=1 Tax=Francisella opportunistica TaxID=2016517 RepID=A0A345JTS7_9GAMM|nr:hypothetical protein CGC43_07055 [Francisella opportunistica]
MEKRHNFFCKIIHKKYNNLKPYQYYVDIMKRLPYSKIIEDYAALLPWSVINA